MKQQFKPIALTLCLLGFTTLPAFATEHLPNSLEKKLNKMESEIASLKKELHSTKSKKRTVTSTESEGTGLESKTLQARAEAGEKRAEKTEPNISGPDYLPTAGYDYFPIDIDVPGQSFVSTGPYIGVPLQFNGSNLIINHPSVNQDVALLNLRKNISERLMALNLKPEDQKSHLLLSGLVEGQANYRNVGGGHNSSDIDLTSAVLDAYIFGPSSWTSGLMTFEYDNNIGALTGSFSNFSRSQNSRVFINKGFIVVGDFTRSPFYGTLGQMYVPFGTYSTTMISSPLTKLIFRTQARAALVGFQQQSPCAFYASAFTFRGDSHIEEAAGRINNGGVNLGYRFERGDISGNIGGGWIANSADSQGMQNNGFSVVPPTVPPTPPIFTGFGGVTGSGSELLEHRVPAFDVRGIFSFGKAVDFLFEYIASTTSFSTEDMTFNGRGAKPRALDVELTYTFQKIEKPTSLSVGYSRAVDALALGMPANRYSAVVNTSFWRNTLQSLEFRHDNNYAASDTATGSEVPVPSASGRSDNILTAQFDIYF